MKPRKNFLCESFERRMLFSGGTITFSPHVDFVAGTAPVALVAGDFNGDGNQDLAVADSQTRQVNLFFGNGAGGFTAGPSLKLSGVPTAIISGDFNGDGEPDLAVACSPLAGQTASTVTIFLNLGGGGFGLGLITTVVTGAVPGDTVELAAGDFNKDGFLDLAVTDFNTRSISVLLGTGSGTFASPRNYLPQSNPTAIAVGDFNNDGKLDLAVTNTVVNAVFEGGNVVQLWLGSPSGNFTANGSLALNLSGTPTSIATANLTGSATSGLVVGNSDGTIAVVKNNNGSLSLSTKVFTGLAVGSVATSDLNLNGNVDFVAANTGTSAGSISNKVSVVPGTGKGNVSTPLSFETGVQPADVVVADFNNDGRPDIATANTTGGTVSVLINTSKAPLVSTNTVITSSGDSTPAGSDLTLTATVTGSKPSVLPGVLYPTGTVAFFDGSTQIGTAAITPNTNQAVFTINSLIVGVHKLKAVYRGDDAFAASQSAQISQTITPTATDGPDLVGTFISSTFADQIAPGQTCSVLIRISNMGNSPAIGALTNMLYLSVDGVVDPSDTILIAKGALGKSNINLKPGKSVTLKGNVTVPTDAALGSYLLLTDLNTTGTILEYNRNDAVVSPTSYMVADVFGTLGSNHNVALQLSDLNGTVGTFKLSGPGKGTLEVGGSGLDLTLTGTTTGSTLNITNKGGPFQLDTISADAAIRTVNAGGVAVNHTLVLAGARATIKLASFGTSGGDAMTLGAGAQTAITVGTVSGGTLSATSGIKSLSVGGWGSGSIEAPSIGTLSSKGDFNPQLSLSDTGTSLKSANISGSVAGAWGIAGSIGSVTIKGNLLSGKVNAGFNINSVVVNGSISTSQILAGLAGPGVFGKIRVVGEVPSSRVGAGATPSDTTSGLPATALGSDGTIRTISISGAVDAESRFLAAALPKRATLGGVGVDTASDPRFHF